MLTNTSHRKNTMRLLGFIRLYALNINLNITCNNVYIRTKVSKARSVSCLSQLYGYLKRKFLVYSGTLYTPECSGYRIAMRW